MPTRRSFMKFRFVRGGSTLLPFTAANTTVRPPPDP